VRVQTGQQQQQQQCQGVRHVLCFTPARQTQATMLL
jgi:hypothetical protein